MESHGRYTISYRSIEARQVMDWIRAGQSGCLIGLRGVGKSNFLRFLLHSDVQQYYLGQNQPDYLFVLVNLLSLAEDTSWGFYELLVTSLLDQFRLQQAKSDVIEEISVLQREISHSRDMLTARRAVEAAVAILCRLHARRLVLFFDEFDAAFGNFDSSLFRILRTTRDAHKDQISYVVVVTRDLAQLRNNAAEDVEHFYRLVSRNICGLGPYNEADSQQLLTYLLAQRSAKLNERDAAQLIELSGGHAGLLKAITSLLWGPAYDGDLKKLNQTINDEPIVLHECCKVWDGLSKDEQIILNSLVEDQPLNPQAENWLKSRGILREMNPSRLFSPLFKTFILKQTPPSVKNTLVRRSPRLVQINGQEIETLTELEFEALSYLYEHREQVCTKEDLIQAVYRQQYSVRRGDLTDAMLQTLISRLREKIEPERDHPHYVITVRGEGYRFVESNNYGYGQ